jgi:hypothetical protein
MCGSPAVPQVVLQKSTPFPSTQLVELCKWAANAWPTANEIAETANIDKTIFLNIGRPAMT